MRLASPGRRWGASVLGVAILVVVFVAFGTPFSLSQDEPDACAGYENEAYPFCDTYCTAEWNCDADPAADGDKRSYAFSRFVGITGETEPPCER